MVNIGFLAALGAALAWGSFMVPFKKSQSSNLIQFQAVMATGIGLSGFIISAVLGYPLSLNVYGLLSGVLWATANVLSLAAIYNLGLCRAVPLVASLVIISSFIWGAVIFEEMPAGMAVGILGLLLIIVGVIVVSMTENTKSQNIRKGLVMGTLAGLIFGSQLVPLKIGNVATGDFFFPVCMGIFAAGAFIALILRVRPEKTAIKAALFGGVIWNIGNLMSLISLSLIGLSKMGPISQSATLIAVFWGLFYFKEIRNRQAKLQVLIGAIVLIAGVAVLGLA